MGLGLPDFRELTHPSIVVITIGHRIRFQQLPVWHRHGCHDRQKTLALLKPLASRFGLDRANLAFPRRFWRKRPKGSPLWRIARTDLFSTWHTLVCPDTSQCQPVPLSGANLFKIAHLACPAQIVHSKNEIEQRTIPYGNLLFTRVFSVDDAIFFQYRRARAESDSGS